MRAKAAGLEASARAPATKAAAKYRTICRLRESPPPQISFPEKASRLVTQARHSPNPKRSQRKGTSAFPLGTCGSSVVT